MIKVLDVLEPYLDDGVVQMCGNDIVHESGNAVGTAQALVERSGHGGLLVL